MHKTEKELSKRYIAKQTEMPPNKMKTHSPSKRKPPAWKCPCGYIIPKKGAKLSGSPEYNKGYHIHCPKCTRTVAQFIDPKETQ